MTTFRIEYRVSVLYTGEIDIPDTIHPSKRADYVRFHLDSIQAEEPIAGTQDVEIRDEWIDEI